MSSVLQRAGSQLSSRAAVADDTDAAQESTNSDPGEGQQQVGNAVDKERRKELKKIYKKYGPKFLRNSLANLNLSQEGLLPVLVNRLIDATLLLEKGVAPTTHAQQTGQIVELEVEAPETTLKPGNFSDNADINDPLRPTRRRESLKQFKDDINARPPPTKEQQSQQDRTKYMSKVFQNQVASAHKTLLSREAQVRVAKQNEQEIAQKVHEDQKRIDEENITRARAKEMARQRRISIHGGIDPLEPPKKDREELVQAIRDEIKDFSVKQLVNALALKGLNDKHMVTLAGGGREIRRLRRDGLVDRLHAKLVEERLGPDDDVLVNALLLLGLDPGKASFSASERAKLKKEMARLTRDKLAKEQERMRAEMRIEQQKALERQKQQELEIAAVRNAEMERVHSGMEEIATQQRLAIHSAVKSIHPLRKNHFDSQPNGFPPLNEFLPDDYVESEVEKYAKAKERDAEKMHEAEAMAVYMHAVNRRASEDRKRASESHFAPNTKSDFLYGNLVVNESIPRHVPFGIGANKLEQKPARYVGPVWRERPVKPPKKIYSRGEVMNMLFWGSYRGSVEDVRKAIPLIDWNNGINFQFEVGAGLNHPASAHGDTALHIAARQGHSKVVRELINRGANHEIKNKSLQTAFEVVRNVDTSRMKYDRRDAYRKILLLLGKLRGRKMEYVEEWLASLKGTGAEAKGLEMYAEKFEKCGYDDISLIAMLSVDGVAKLIADVEMTNRGHSNRLRQAIDIKSQELSGKITAEEAAAKVAKLSDLRAKVEIVKKPGLTPFQDDLLNGSRELQKISRRKLIQEARAKVEDASRVRGSQNSQSRNWRFRADAFNADAAQQRLRIAAEEASKPQFKEVYPVGYDPPDPSDKSGEGYPTLKWSERRRMNTRKSGFF